MASIEKIFFGSLTRSPVTPVEKEVLQDLIETLSNTGSQFCCGGTIQLLSEQKLSLTYNAGASGLANILELPSTDLDAITKLIDACAPSSHGRGGETVYDESYRLARELPQGGFSLTTEILSESDVLASISPLTSSRAPNEGLVARLYKLNAYATGGFFKPHRDTPKSDRHIGTLVVVLPIPFEGGALLVSHGGKQVQFDWSKSKPGLGAQDKVSLPWAFLFSDVEHEVLPVTSGTRVTLAYDIFTSEGAQLMGLSRMDGATVPLYADLENALNNKDFLPQGGKVGVALSHAYPVKTHGTSNAFASLLKGSDAVLHCVLSALHVPMEILAVYWCDDEDSYYTSRRHANKDAVGVPDDGFGATRIANRRPWFSFRFRPTPQVLYTSIPVQPREYQIRWEDGPTAFLKTEYNACIATDIIWVRKPADDTFSHSAHYIAYGNEAEQATVYAAAAFIIDIPAIGIFPRNSL
ncbi:hypothetical protein K439DRAFT_1663658 [Ramaria rubella]|nr:hypothetical protein K439DRAFT_1663658 [Ramaria rubella]